LGEQAVRRNFILLRALLFYSDGRERPLVEERLTEPVINATPTGCWHLEMITVAGKGLIGEFLLPQIDQDHVRNIDA